MTRSARCAGICVALLACQSGTDSPSAVPAVVVSDSLGTLLGVVSPSPDGTRLAYAQTVAGKAAIFVSAADGSNPRQLTHGVWDSNPYWSPDGKWIAYHAESPDFDIFVVPADGGEPRQLTSGPATDQPNAWVPDGSGVVFIRAGDGDDQTMVAPLDGGPARRLGPELKGNHHVAISPDGKMLAWDVHVGAGDATIWVQDSAGAAPRQLTTENLEVAQTPWMWSPDGTKLVYLSRRTGTQDIWTVDVRTGEQKQLTSDVRDDLQPRWSPDGRWIAFLSERGGQQDVWIVSSDGGKAVRVTNDRNFENPPRWSPDGNTLYFLSDQGSDQLQLLPTDSGPARTLVSWPGYDLTAAALSPDGQTVLFDSNRSGNVDIWSVPVMGGEPKVFAASPLTDRLPRYSPDGSQVLFLSDRAGTVDVWVMPASGGEARALTGSPGNESEPFWSPDGTAIAFRSTRGAPGGEVWVVQTAEGEPTRLTHGTPMGWSPDGKYVYFAGTKAGGIRELYRIAATGGRFQALGAAPGVGTAALSPDGSQLAYWTFEGGWAFTHVMPAAGGSSRRLTQESENVYQPGGVWSPDGKSLMVAELDLQGNRDAFDLVSVQLSDGRWQKRTATPTQTENLQAFSRDGRQMLIVVEEERSSIQRASVAALLSAPAARD